MLGSPVLLLSTAEDLTSGYLTSAGRHSEGALLAPGFYPDNADPAHKPFVDRFVAAYGRAPLAGVLVGAACQAPRRSCDSDSGAGKYL